MVLMVIFGGEDVESATARDVARQAGCVVATAVTADGKKVHNGNAYQAVSYAVDSGDVADVTGVVIFECAPAVAGALPVVARCDHHNPGDPGWGLGAADYWQASSLGQLCELLGQTSTPELRLVAAGDHSPAGAYLGLCPGIDPAEFAKWRIAGKVAFYAANPRTADKADAEKVCVAIEVAKYILQRSKLVHGVRDLLAEGEIDELPEAALSTGQAYMAALPDTDRARNSTGNTKIVLGGHATAETVKRFMEWANTLPNRVGDAYGNPDRGFGGVVIDTLRAKLCAGGERRAGGTTLGAKKIAFERRMAAFEKGAVVLLNAGADDPALVVMFEDILYDENLVRNYIQRLRKGERFFVSND